MPNTVRIAESLYSQPPKTSYPGVNSDYRSIEVAVADLVTTKLVAINILPAGHRLDGFALESDALDSGNALTITLGILNSNYNAALDDAPDLVTDKDIIQASTIGRAGGRIEYSPLAFATAIGVDYSNNRIIAAKFPAAAGSGAIGTLAVQIHSHFESY